MPPERQGRRGNRLEAGGKGLPGELSWEGGEAAPAAAAEPAHRLRRLAAAAVLLGRQETGHLQTSPFLHLPLLVSQGNQEQLCGPCICTIGETLAPAAAAAGITPEQVQSTSEADARALITACAGVLIRPLTAADVRLNSLMALQQCSALPKCLEKLGFKV